MRVRFATVVLMVLVLLALGFSPPFASVRAYGRLYLTALSTPNPYEQLDAQGISRMLHALEEEKKGLDWSLGYARTKNQKDLIRSKIENWTIRRAQLKQRRLFLRLDRGLEGAARRLEWLAEKEHFGYALAAGGLVLLGFITLRRRRRRRRARHPMLPALKAPGPDGPADRPFTIEIPDDLKRSLPSVKPRADAGGTFVDPARADSDPRPPAMDRARKMEGCASAAYSGQERGGEGAPSEGAGTERGDGGAVPRTNGRSTTSGDPGGETSTQVNEGARDALLSVSDPLDTPASDGNEGPSPLSAPGGIDPLTQVKSLLADERTTPERFLNALSQILDGDSYHKAIARLDGEYAAFTLEAPGQEHMIGRLSEARFLRLVLTIQYLSDERGREGSWTLVIGDGFRRLQWRFQEDELVLSIME